VTGWLVYLRAMETVVSAWGGRLSPPPGGGDILGEHAAHGGTSYTHGEPRGRLDPRRGGMFAAAAGGEQELLLQLLLERAFGFRGNGFEALHCLLGASRSQLAHFGGCLGAPGRRLGPSRWLAR
jgi:hypothetical protein